uniref:Uncharacterized protein n=1 Tax=Rhodnius prolixus TaxID=13249 RepID=T1HR53_RHOPR
MSETESRISRVVKLLMNKDEQKAQEEMAWRVAEMIVKDITSITMGNPDDPVQNEGKIQTN